MSAERSIADIDEKYHELMLLAAMVEDSIPYHIINSTRAGIGPFAALFEPIDRSHSASSTTRGFMTTARAVGGYTDSMQRTGGYARDDDDLPMMIVF